MIKNEKGKKGTKRKRERTGERKIESFGLKRGNKENLKKTLPVNKSYEYFWPAFYFGF